MRGLILRELRGSDIPVTAAEIATLWPDAAQRDRALAGLLADGLAVEVPAEYLRLPLLGSRRRRNARL